MRRAERGFSSLSRVALAIFWALAALGLASCSIAGYASQGEAEETEAPIAVFSNYTHTVVERGKTLLELKATRAELYEKSKKTVLFGVDFSEYDSDSGELESSGSADQAIYHTDTKDAEFSGSVKLQSKKQDAVLQGEYLRWIDKDKRLEGRLDRTVTISRADGSSVSGAGFEASSKNRSFSFRGSVEGRIEATPKGASEGAQ